MAVIKSNLVDFMETAEANRVGTVSANVPEAAPEAPAAPAMADCVLGAHMKGTMQLLAQVPDDAFASGALGEGVAIDPSEGKLYAPADCTVDNVFDTKHAIGLITDDGTELLLHIGIDTVKLNGKHFTTHVEAGQHLKKGDLMISFDMAAIKAAGYPCVTPMIVCNTDQYKSIKPLVTGTVKPGQDLLSLKG